MITIGEIAAAAGGRVEGDDAFRVRRLSSLKNAEADSLAFYAGGRGAKDRALETTAAGAVMLRAECAQRFPRHRVIVEDAYLAYARASALFAPPPKNCGAHKTAAIAPNASVHKDAALGAYAVVGENSVIESGAHIGAHVTVGADCVIGRDTAIESGVHIGARTRIGARCRISSGVVIGAGGFGYAENSSDGGVQWERIEQLGGVRIGDDVDIGANTTIDRGALDDTVIGDGVKLDNHIQIAHNVRIGAHTIMAGCAAVAGSAVIGARCRLGGRASVLGHLEIADDVHIHADGFVAASIFQAGEYSSLISAQPAEKWRKTAAHIRRLEQLAEKVKRLQRACPQPPEQGGKNQ
ncbi:MAG: UDP-3-O-(3-hydroxymyristoyl)glucosamine N-acyltransferase [Gammaproteobacteria bacterium]|nr:UDP-3-O-(3-hydroxymyristoyl)glucosamine N-acyltransferase [Gammaproteobacteria bacterium]